MQGVFLLLLCFPYPNYMKKRWVFTVGFIIGAVVGIGSLMAWASAKLPKSQARTPSAFKDATLQRLPFDDEWTVFWGGETRRENHHHGIAPQNLALDVVITAPGTQTTFSGDRSKNENFYCWGKPLYAPFDGVVEISVDGIPDNMPGVMNAHMVSGNCVMVRSPDGAVAVLCHLVNGSVKRVKGDKVKAGDLLGLCGNSGHSSEPHLHFHVQSETGFVRGEAMRPVFQSIVVNGSPKASHSPKKGERIANAAKQ